MAMSRRCIVDGTITTEADHPSRPPTAGGMVTRLWGWRPLGGRVLVAVAALLVAAGLVTGGQQAGAAIAHKVSPGFGEDTGWSVGRHPRFVADVTGDGRADLVGFGYDGVWVAVARADRTFAPEQFVLADFGYNSGCCAGHTVRFVADITGDGRADLVSFGQAGTYTAVARADGTFTPAELVLVGVGGSFLQDVDADGCADLIRINYGTTEIHVAYARPERPGLFVHPQLVSTTFPHGGLFHVADITGDRYADLLTFYLAPSGGIERAFTAVSLPQGTAPYAEFQDIGLGSHKLLLDVAFTDVTRDGRADLVGFGYYPDVSPDGVFGTFRAIATGHGTFAETHRVIDDFSPNEGWRSDRHLRRVVDVTDDGSADIVGFGEAGVWVSVARGDGSFHAVQLGFDDLVYNTGWRVERHPRFVADVTGDGCADLVGFGIDGTYVAFSRCDGTFE